MKRYFSCTECVTMCMQTQRFAISHLIKNEKTLSIHLHDCHEIYYSISGGKQFFINGLYFDIAPGDVFLIRQNANHHITQLDQETHERINVSVHPSFLHMLSTASTNLTECFDSGNMRLRLTLNAVQQQRFLYLCDQIALCEGFGSDVLENSIFAELMVLINTIWMQQNKQDIPEEEREVDASTNSHSAAVAHNVIDYLNANITDNLSLDNLAAAMFISKSYLCRIFKAHTGTTIQEYFSARRISLAKCLLDDGKKPGDVCAELGFSNYSSFYKLFLTYTGVSPQNYMRLNHHVY